jgi:hypothetical protein
MAFATAADVATRLGRNLTTEESAMAEQVIESVTAQIVDAVDRDLDWAAALDPVPGLLKSLCVEKVIVVGSNPQGLASESRTLGQASSSKTFQRSNDAGIFLTDQEQRLVRMAVYGSLSGSSTPRTVPDRLIDLRENRDVDEVEA